MDRYTNLDHQSFLGVEQRLVCFVPIGDYVATMAFHASVFEEGYEQPATPVRSMLLLDGCLGFPPFPRDLPFSVVPASPTHPSGTGPFTEDDKPEPAHQPADPSIRRDGDASNFLKSESAEPKLKESAHRLCAIAMPPPLGSKLDATLRRARIETATAQPAAPDDVLRLLACDDQSPIE